LPTTWEWEGTASSARQIPNSLRSLLERRLKRDACPSGLLSHRTSRPRGGEARRPTDTSLAGQRARPSPAAGAFPRRQPPPPPAAGEGARRRERGPWCRGRAGVGLRSPRLERAERERAQPGAAGGPCSPCQRRPGRSRPAARARARAANADPFPAPPGLPAAPLS